MNAPPRAGFLGRWLLSIAVAHLAGCGPDAAVPSSTGAGTDGATETSGDSADVGTHNGSSGGERTPNASGAESSGTTVTDATAVATAVATASGVTAGTTGPVYEGGYHQVTCDGPLVVHQGDLEIGESTDPALVACVREVTGRLSVGKTTTWVDLQPLSNVERVGTAFATSVSYPEREKGSFLVYNNSTLRSLRGLDRLRGVAGQLDIAYNPRLNDLTALGGIEELGGFTVYSNASLRQLDGLQGTIKVPPPGIVLSIEQNPVLESLDGILAIDGFERPEGARDGFAVIDNPLIEDTSPIAHLWEGDNPNTSFSFSGASLRNVDALRNVRSLSDLSVDTTVVLEDLAGAAQLESVGLLLLGNCEYYDYGPERANLGLRSLHGLEGLRSVQILTLVGNPRLTDISALDGLAPTRHALVAANLALPPDQEATLLAKGGTKDSVCSNGGERCVCGVPLECRQPKSLFELQCPYP